MPCVRHAGVIALVAAGTATGLSAALMRARRALRRIVRGVAYATGSVILAVAGAGCGTDQAHEATSEARLTAAVLSEQDMPTDYLPAENTAVFRGVKPTSPACRELFALADVRDLRDVPRADAAFYQVDPGGAVAEHLLQMTPLRAHEYISGARAAGAGCRRIIVRTPEYMMRLRQRPMSMRPVGEESYAVRYAGWAGDRHRFHLDMVMARVSDRLLIMANLALMPAGKDRDLVGQIADRAVAKLGEVGSGGVTDRARATPSIG